MGIKRLRCLATDSVIRECSDKNWKRKGIKNCQERCAKLVYLIFLQEVADHAHPTAVWCSVEQSLIDGTLTNIQHTCELVFKPKMDILNIRRDYQFAFSVLD